MKKNTMKTTVGETVRLAGEVADRIRPPYASDEKRRQAAELFEHGIGYQRASRILDLPANTLRDWAAAWRAGRFRTSISPHLYRYPEEVRRKAVNMRLAGCSWSEIEEETGVGASTCKRWLDAHRAAEDARNSRTKTS